MRISDLLVGLKGDELGTLAARIVGERSQPSSWAYDIEHALGQFTWVDKVILASRPPVASLLLRLADAPEHVLEVEKIRPEVDAEVDGWCRLVTTGELANRIPDRARIYRRVLEAAWHDDEVLDASEIRLLTLLREELGLLRMEHFLLAHHSAIQPLWRHERALEDVVRELAEAGIVYEVHPGRIALPDELVPHVRRSLGVAMSNDAVRRLLMRLDSGSHLRAALEDHDLPTSGSKQERIERIIQNFVPMNRVVDTMHIEDARELARKLGLPVRGAKEELVNRIVDHFSVGGDIAIEGVEEEEKAEIKQLQEMGFAALFDQLKGHQLQQLLLAFQLRHSGSKQTKIATLWGSPFSEATLLAKLKNPDLDELLSRSQLVCRGSKAEKVTTLVEAYRSHVSESIQATTDDEEPGASAPDGGGISAIRGLLVEVELSSKSPNRFDAVRAYLAGSADIDPSTVGVKWLGDAKNHRNRVSEALRGTPALLLLLAPREEADAVLEAARSRMAQSPETAFLTILCSTDPSDWDVGTIMSAVESPLVEVLARTFGSAEIQLVGYPREIEQEHVQEFVRSAERELAIEWRSDDLPLESKIRRGLQRAFGRLDTNIRTKHISDLRNVGNRISEAIGAGCEALVLFVAFEVAEATRMEVRRQLGTIGAPALAVLIVESDTEGYHEPEVIGAERET